MRKCATLTTVFAGVLLLTWLGLSFWSGLRAEEAYYSSLSDLGHSPLLTVSSQDFNRGLFSSTSLTRVTFPSRAAAEPDDPGLVLLVEQEIDHGPFSLRRAGLKPVLAVVSTRVASDPDTMTPALSGPGGGIDLSAIQQRTVIDISGGGTFSLSVPPAALKADSSGPLFFWGGLELSGRFSGQGRTVQGVLSAPGLELRQPGQTLAFSGLRLDFDLEQNPSLAFTGTTLLEVDSLAASHPTSLPRGGTVDSLQVRNDFEETNGLVRVSSSISAERILTSNATFGPLLLEQELQNLDSAGLAALHRAGRKLSGAADGMTDAQVQGMVDEARSNILPVLLAASPEIHLKRLRFTTPQGDVTASGHILFNGQHPHSLATPLSLLGALSLQTDLRLPEEILLNLLRSASAAPGVLIDRLVAKRVLARKGSDLLLDLRYQDGRITLNDRPVSLLELLALVAG